MTGFFLGIAGGSALLYLVIALFFLKNGITAPSGDSKRKSRFTVLRRDKKVIALRADAGFSALPGLLFAALFYLGLPVYVWRYGWLRTFGLLGLPVGIAVGAARIAVVLGGTDEGAFALGALFSIPLRAGFGIYVALRDPHMREANLLSRGWLRVETRFAKSARAARRGL